MIVQRHMGDYSLDVIKGALDEIIAILKAEGVKDADRKAESRASLIASRRPTSIASQCWVSN